MTSIASFESPAIGNGYRIAWLSIPWKVGVVEAERVVSIEFLGVEDSDCDGVTVMESVTVEIRQREWQLEVKEWGRNGGGWWRIEAWRGKILKGGRKGLYTDS